MPPQRRKIGFLLNHERPHQALHILPIVRALAADDREDIVLFASTAPVVEHIHAHLDAQTLSRIALHRLAPMPGARFLERLIGNAAPLSRIGVLIRNRRRLGALDWLIAPESTCTLLKKRLGQKDLKIIRIIHGSGQRHKPFGYDAFSFVLSPSEEFKRWLVEKNVIAEDRIAVIGYPKFDAVDLDKAPKLFDDDKPIVLYNPHYHPLQSSWFDIGIDILDYFASQSRCNLIFAPHAMLFARRLHIAFKTRRVRLRRNLPKRFLNHPRILVDLGGPACFDMTYTRAADIYLGDVSSQVQEFLHRPRPCLFLNPNALDVENDPDLDHFKLGTVLNAVDDLHKALSNLPDDRDDPRLDLQRKAFETAFASPPEGASRRAADAIRQIIAENGRD